MKLKSAQSSSGEALAVSGYFVYTRSAKWSDLKPSTSKTFQQTKMPIRTGIKSAFGTLCCFFMIAAAALAGLTFEANTYPIPSHPPMS